MANIIAKDGAGATDLGVLTDYDGVVRGAAVDIGAYEYVA